ncbi:MAG: MOSC domain-containing protein [Terriglobia bacterium]|jgi:MOSC domain-containing protein YiiM|nr:MOSC domain-containing protein [Terriglobia bacterium]
MEVISVNVGEPRRIVWRDMTVLTAIFKQPVDGRVMVARRNLAGDRQADLRVHGGVKKAVYGYPAEHYEYWRGEFPEADLTWGNFGENLTTSGLLEDQVCIGDHLRVGSAVLMVTQPRMPCYKLAVRFNRDDMVKRFWLSRRPGYYFAVVEEGELGAGSRIEFVHRDSERVSVRDVVDLFLGRERSPELLGRALRLEVLPETWKDELRERADRGTATAESSLHGE